MKKILLGITGCIAAYKIPIIISVLRKKCPDTYIITMTTENALDFITPTVLTVKSDEYLNTSMTGKKITHVDFVKDLDVLAIVPATANTIAKIAGGIADNLLLSSILATPMAVPRIIFPAMNSDMYLNIATQKNIDLLIQNQWYVVEPVVGNLACGITGVGKLPSVSTVVDSILALSRVKIRIKNEAKDSQFWFADYVGKTFDVVKCHTNNPIYFNDYAVSDPLNPSHVLFIMDDMCEEV